MNENIGIGNQNIEAFLKSTMDEIGDVKPLEEVLEENDNYDGLHNKIESLKESAETIAFSYNDKENRCEIYSNLGKGMISTNYFHISEDEYLDLCKEYDIDETQEYNYSGWVYTNAGDLMRVYAVTRPICKYPNVTFNISRPPTGDIQQPEVIPHIHDIVTNSFIIVGASGSGKTFFLNNCLKREFTDSDNRIILVEEFHELFPPNRHTICLDVPSDKPGGIPVFDYIVAKTNLMRAQNIFVGEIKGKEAWPFVLNCASGTAGGCTMHGKSVEDGLARLQMLMATAGVCDRETCGDLISKAIRYAVYIDKHRVVDIKRLTGVFNRTTNKWQLENIL